MRGGTGPEESRSSRLGAEPISTRAGTAGWLRRSCREGVGAGCDSLSSSGTMPRGRSSAASSVGRARRSSSAVARANRIASETGRVRSSGSALVSDAGSHLIGRSSRVRRRSSPAAGGGGRRSSNEGLLSSEGDGFGRSSSDPTRRAPRLSSGSWRRGGGV